MRHYITSANYYMDSIQEWTSMIYENSHETCDENDKVSF